MQVNGLFFVTVVNISLDPRAADKSCDFHAASASWLEMNEIWISYHLVSRIPSHRDDIVCQDSKKLLRGIHKYRQFYISSFITLRGADIYG